MMKYTLNNGERSGNVEIVDQDRLCYLVRNFSRGTSSLRTISKDLLDEYINYVKDHPDVSSYDARIALSGETDIDKFEYGYTATLLTMAHMALGNATFVDDTHQSKTVAHLPLQQVFYGAPGTGKSRTIKDKTAGKDVVRTTFHPDTDYSTFVGAYKPTTKTIPVMTVIGTKAVAVEDGKGNPVTEDKIVYEFVPQAFLQAYVAAWLKLGKAEGIDLAEPEFLVIEEINRGNCAQIFGDLFQLLDRQDCGFSEYPIKADADMRRFLMEALKDLDLSGIGAELNKRFDRENIAKQVKEGDILVLPNNLFIWATMNTSDQSLFPIDSAFKRRWDWQYVPINDAGMGWTLRVGGSDYSWWNFLEEINRRIYEATYSEDKKLGYFFCKAKDGVIDAERFVGKVVFYLWNDVFKDSELEGDAFRDTDGTKLTFDKFYTVVAGKTVAVEEKAEVFLKNLGLAPMALSAGNESDVDKSSD